MSQINESPTAVVTNHVDESPAEAVAVVVADSLSAKKPSAGPGFFRRLGTGIKNVVTSQPVKIAGSALGNAAYVVGVTTLAMVATGAIVGRVPALHGRHK